MSKISDTRISRSKDVTSNTDINLCLHCVGVGELLLHVLQAVKLITQSADGVLCTRQLHRSVVHSSCRWAGSVVLRFIDSTVHSWLVHKDIQTYVHVADYILGEVVNGSEHRYDATMQGHNLTSWRYLLERLRNRCGAHLRVETISVLFRFQAVRPNEWSLL